MFIVQTVATRGARRPFPAGADGLMSSDMFVDVLHETYKYV